jgi:hypothetical protein
MSDQKYQEAWAKFTAGHWQQTIPQKKGEYPIATRDGLFCGVRGVVFLYEGRYQSAGPHQGFWWSEPMPDFPPTGPWKPFFGKS